MINILIGLSILFGVLYSAYFIVTWFGRFYYIGDAKLRDVSEIKIDDLNTIINCTVHRWGMPSFKLEVLQQKAYVKQSEPLFYNSTNGKRLNLRSAIDKYNAYATEINRIEEIEDLKIKALMKGTE